MNKRVQETFSYYGFLNAVTFNVGYRDGHHDFPSVPWNRLPQIRAAAPETYDHLSAHTSWTRLLRASPGSMRPFGSTHDRDSVFDVTTR